MYGENEQCEYESGSGQGLEDKKISEKLVSPKKRTRDLSCSSVTDSQSNKISSPRKKKRHYELESDPEVLARRQKQIDYGKNTVGYDKYIQAVPKKDRKKHHPTTPPKHYKYSRRAWDGLVKIWRQQLHFWDELDGSNESKRLTIDDECSLDNDMTVGEDSLISKS